MSNYNPEFFKSIRLSEQLASTAKDHLDEIGRPDLKKQLDDALFDGGKGDTTVDFGNSPGWTV